MNLQNEAAEEENARRHDAFDNRRAVLWACLGVTLIFVLLQCWKPFFFLNDDNLDGWLPVVVDMGRSLWSGHSPFISPHLFGGGYDLLPDPGALCLWNPLTIGLSLLGGTFLRNALVDLYVGFNWLLGAWAFSHLLCRVRQKWAPDLDDGRIAFLTVSYIASAYAILVDSSWLSFSANAAAFPICFLGIWHPRRRIGIVLVTCGFWHGFLVGHLSPFLWSLLFGLLFVIAFCRVEASWEALRRWILGLMWALAGASPLLWIAARGFLSSARGAHLPVADAALMNVPLPVLLLSFWSGALSVIGGQFQIWMLAPGLSYAIAACCAAFWVFHSIGAKKPATPIEKCCLLCIVLLMLFIVRPPSLSAIVSQVPLFRSLRHPFREIWLLLFWIHVWIALRPVKVSARGARLSSVVGMATVILSLLPFGTPAFTRSDIDRRLLLSGAADAHWNQVRDLLPPGGSVLPVSSLSPKEFYRGQVPQILLGDCNYPALFGVRSASGYVIRGLATDRDGKERLPGPSGVWRPLAARRRMAREPKLRALVWHADSPAHLSLDSATASKVLWPPLLSPPQ